MIALLADYHRFIEYKPTISFLFFNDFFHSAHGKAIS